MSRRDDERLGWLLTTPVLLLIFGLAIIPVAAAFIQSFFLRDLTVPQLGTPFVGFGNYGYIVRDSRFWSALGNTIGFTAISVTLETLLGLGIALLLHKAFRGQGLMRAILLLPWVLSPVVAAQMWHWMVNDRVGVINDIFIHLGLIQKPVAWLASVETARLTIIVADVWKCTPFMALLLMAGLNAIPKSVEEAAAVDGASPWQTFWHITLPLLRPVLLVAILFRSVDAFRIFDLVFMLTGGAFGTETMATLTSDVTFSFSDYGMGSALSVLLFGCVAVMAYAFLQLLGADPYGDNPR